MNGYTFYDYIDANGENIVKTWLNSIDRKSKAKYRVMIPNLEASNPPRFQDTFWKPPHVKFMHGNWGGFVELRVEVKNIQYRLIRKMYEYDVLLVANAVHKGNYMPDTTPEEAQNRVNQMINNPGKYRRDHE